MTDRTKMDPGAVQVSPSLAGDPLQVPASSPSSPLQGETLAPGVVLAGGTLYLRNADGGDALVLSPAETDAMRAALAMDIEPGTWQRIPLSDDPARRELVIGRRPLDAWNGPGVRYIRGGRTAVDLPPLDDDTCTCGHAISEPHAEHVPDCPAWDGRAPLADDTDAETLGAYWRDALADIEHVAQSWHGGQSSALYAVGSAGLEAQTVDTIESAARELERATATAGPDVDGGELAAAVEAAAALRALVDLATNHPANADADDYDDMTGRYDRDAGTWSVDR